MDLEHISMPKPQLQTTNYQLLTTPEAEQARYGAGNHSLQTDRGFAALYAVLVLLTIFGLLAGVFSQLALKNTFQKRTGAINLQNAYAAEGFLEDALRRVYDPLLADPVSGENSVLSGASVVLSAEAAEAGRRYIFKATSQEKYSQTQTAAVDDGSVSASFNYALQIGEGGLVMGNDGRVEGTVFSNGSVRGGSGTTITGSAFLAATSTLGSVTVNQDAVAFRIENSTIGGHATATDIVDSTISGNAVANLLQDCTIGQNAYYNILTRCTVGGSKTSPIIPPVNLPAANFPISADQMTFWENEASAGGTISGNYNVSSDGSLGPKAITGDLKVDNGQTLTLTGTIWVKGKLILGNNAVVKLSSAYGSNSGVLLVDGEADFGNGVVFSGSGQSSSHLMIVSRAVSPAKAFELGNNVVAGAILYAPYGEVDIGNNIEVKEITAYKINMGNGSVLKYESGLADIKFTGGSAVTPKIKSWQESL